MEKQNFHVQLAGISISKVKNSQENTLKEPPTVAEIEEWIVSYLADILEIEPDEIDSTIPFDCYGLDSTVVVGLTGDLEDWLEHKLDPTLLYNYPTIQALVQHLADEIKLVNDKHHKN